MKSDGDFEDILAEKTPAIWRSNRPAKGGEAGAMLAQIIERAAKLKTDRDDGRPRTHETTKKTQPHRSAQKKERDEGTPRKHETTKRNQPRQAAASRYDRRGPLRNIRERRRLQLPERKALRSLCDSAAALHVVTRH